MISSSIFPDLLHNLKIVEVDDAVRLRPKPGFASSGEGRVLDFKHFLVVQTHGEEVAMKVDTQSAPSLLGNPVFYAVAVRHSAFGRKGQPLTVLHFVKHNVIFKRVGAHDVVVIGVQVAPDQSGTLIHAAGYRFELDGECAVFKDGAIPNGQRKASRRTVRRNLCQNIRLARGRIVLEHLPPRGTASVGHRYDPTGGHCAHSCIVEVDTLTAAYRAGCE